MTEILLGLQRAIDTTVCSYCGAKANGSYGIHRDGFGLGPEVPLCYKCATSPSPTCDEIWARISAASVENG